MRYDYQYFKFGFIGYHRFLIFRKSINRKIKKQKQNILIKQFLKSIQNDIYEVSKDANEKIRYAENIMKNIKLK